MVKDMKVTITRKQLLGAKRAADRLGLSLGPAVDDEVMELEQFHRTAIAGVVGKVEKGPVSHVSLHAGHHVTILTDDEVEWGEHVVAYQCDHCSQRRTKVFYAEYDAVVFRDDLRRGVKTARVCNRCAESVVSP